MKYSININQKAIIDMWLDLDLIDLAIFDYIKDLSNYSKLVKIEIEWKTYFWVQYNHLIENMPLLWITNKKVLLRRLDKLIKVWLLEKQIINWNSTYFRFWKNYDKYVFSEDEKDDEKKEECNSKVIGGVTEKWKGVLLKSNSINYNNKNNNNNNINYFKYELKKLNSRVFWWNKQNQNTDCEFKGNFSNKENLNRTNKENLKENNIMNNNNINYFKDDTLNNSFLDFIEHRKQIKCKMTDLAIDRMVKKIEKWQGKYTNMQIVNFINESISNGRKWIFERKIDENEKKERTPEEIKEMLEFAERFTS